MCKLYFHQYTECLHKVDTRFEECFIAAEATAKNLPFSCDGVSNSFRPEAGYAPKCDECIANEAAAEKEAKREDLLERINSFRRRPAGWIPRSLSTTKKPQAKEEKREGEARRRRYTEAAALTAARYDDRGEPEMIRHSFLVEPDLGPRI